MDAIRLKQILGAPLSEKELMCLQIEQHGFGCHACADHALPPPALSGGCRPGPRSTQPGPRSTQPGRVTRSARMGD